MGECTCGGRIAWRNSAPTCTACGRVVTPNTPYCGVPLVGGWCKRPVGHGGRCACS